LTVQRAQKISITIDEDALKQVDRLVAEQRYPNRSQAIQDAVHELLLRLGQTRLARETARLDPAFEQKLADEGLGDLGEWPEY
jgi:Arc/MetJ-type ribon-helix-helix transcriptional regulator